MGKNLNELFGQPKRSPLPNGGEHHPIHAQGLHAQSCLALLWLHGLQPANLHYSWRALIKQKSEEGGIAPLVSCCPDWSGTFHFTFSCPWNEIFKLSAPMISRLLGLDWIDITSFPGFQLADSRLWNFSGSITHICISTGSPSLENSKHTHTQQRWGCHRGKEESAAQLSYILLLTNFPAVTFFNKKLWLMTKLIVRSLKWLLYHGKHINLTVAQF